MTTTTTPRAPRGSWLSAPPPAPRLPDEEVARRYPRLRFQVFMGIFLGYAGFYLIRNNIPLIAKILLDEGNIDKTGIGLIANAALIAYGLSKFFMAMVSDRSDARYFLPLGLALSAVANLVVAFAPWASGSLAAFAIVMFVNGWVQGMGWPPSGRVLVHWFSTSERGWKTSIWNCAHNVGGMAVGAAAAAGLAMTGNSWQSAFWFPAVLALVVAAVAFVMIRDTPESVGLPPIEEYRNDPDKVTVDVSELEKLSTWELVRKHILMNRAMVLLALANVFVYTLRYGVLTWAPTYLSEVHKVSVTKGIAGFSLFELAGIFGTLACGWVSDRIFAGNRSRTGITFMLGVGVFIVLYWLAPVGTPFWLLMVYLFFIGAFVYGPVMLIGLQALDMSPRHVAGTAAGFTGLFGYVLGATMASTGVGLVAQHYGWDATYALLTAFAVLSVILLAMVGPEEKRLIAEHEARAAARD
ncbi:MFS transporter, OPA family, glycerol-3-phosphate transporter [Austwickia chelonae]|uniref:Glycerol-3-phosphate transporter n=1 Tax=Austwickia chelonae NBRC 105200 TaxID=1184607 RepID=K6VA54_9MICO|nr:MFS transporter [Austwickia chelonae]GAB79108.1 glycerol-3-phosphate transporter [Austwickia chelonae NBRC 105200]SEW42317.1 MFS transporter, OPA family, glycerol-3-phosphate transporter [Austwickia chelonae]